MMRLANKKPVVAADTRHLICRTNPVSLPDFTDKRREATRPLAFRRENFDRDFDSTTLLYDAVRVSDSKVALFAPPFFNLGRDVATTTFLSGGGTCKARARHLDRHAQLWLDIPENAGPIQALGELGSFTFQLSPNGSEIFRNRRVIFTM
jgi:hypothetical protein